MNDKVTISYDLIPLDAEEVKNWAEDTLLLVDCIEKELAVLDMQGDNNARHAHALLLMLMERLEHFGRYAEATMLAEITAGMEDKPYD